MASPVVGVPEYWSEAKAHLRTVDPVMGSLITRHEDPPLRSRGRLFETLVRAIVGQQISAKAADAVWGRFLTTVSVVEPEAVLSCSVEALRKAGLSGRKVEYIRTLAEQGDWLQSVDWRTLEDAEVKKHLCGLRGVGPWTAEMMLIFSLLRPDILPLGDVGVVRSMERHYADGASLTEDKLTAIAEIWRPYRTVAVWYLWRSLDAEPVEY